jgi:hypothetical protein
MGKIFKKLDKFSKFIRKISIQIIILGFGLGVIFGILLLIGIFCTIH